MFAGCLQWLAEARVRQLQLRDGRVLPRHLQGRSGQGAAEVCAVAEDLRRHQVCARLFSTIAVMCFQYRHGIPVIGGCVHTNCVK